MPECEEAVQKPEVTAELKYWTVAPLIESRYPNGEYRLARGRRNQYYSRVSPSALPDGYAYVGTTGWLSALMKAEPREYRLLVNYTAEEAQCAAAEASNAILVKFSDQLYALVKLDWYFALPAWLLNDDTSPAQLPGAVPFSIWVDGCELDQEAGCKACPSSVGRPLLLCQPFRGTCSNFPRPFVAVKCGTPADESRYIRNKQVIDAREPTEQSLSGFPDLAAQELRDWLAAHQMKPLSGTFRPLSAVCRREVFKSWDIRNLVITEEDLKELRKDAEERSDNSQRAAVTRKYKSYFCKGCLEDSQWCSRNGGRNCKGPIYRDDFRALARDVEPWAVHAMLLSGRTVDARQAVPDFRLCHKPQLVVGPRPKFPSKQVLLMRDSIRFSTAPIQYATLCELLGVAPVQSLAELEQLPSSDRCASWKTLSESMRDTVRTVAAIMRRETLECRAGGGFGSCWAGIFGVSVGADRVKLYYSSSSGRHYTSSVVDGYWSDMYRLHKVSLTDARRTETEKVKELLLEGKLKAAADEVRKAMQMVDSRGEEVTEKTVKAALAELKTCEPAPPKEDKKA